MKVVWIHTEEGGRTAIVGEPARIYTPYVMVEFPIRLRRMPNADVAKYCTDMDYPIKRACNRYLKIGRKQGISRGARKFIKGAWA
jgi:hypothetical protein